MPALIRGQDSRPGENQMAYLLLAMITVIAVVVITNSARSSDSLLLLSQKPPAPHRVKRHRRPTRR